MPFFRMMKRTMSWAGDYMKTVPGCQDLIKSKSRRKDRRKKPPVELCSLLLKVQEANLRASPGLARYLQRSMNLLHLDVMAKFKYMLQAV